jgi:hypothetical protein
MASQIRIKALKVFSVAETEIAAGLSPRVKMNHGFLVYLSRGLEVSGLFGVIHFHLVSNNSRINSD